MKKLIYVLTLLIIVHCTLIIDNCQSQWSEQTSGVTTVLYSVSAVDNDVVWICGAGGKVLRTTNGGTNWNLTTSPNSTLALYNILGIDANTAFVTGSGTTAYVYKTVNGGANWSLVFSQVGGFMNAIKKLGSNNTYAIFGDPVGGRWSIFVTENSGTTWDSAGYFLPQAGTETGYNNSVFAWRSGNQDIIYFGTTNSRIYKRIDGQNWVAQSTGTQTDILSISFYDTLALNGGAGSTTGGLYTSNGGANWGNNPTYIGSGSINGLEYTHEGVYYTRGSSVYFSANGTTYTAYTQTGTYNHLTNPPWKNNVWAIRNNGGISKFTSSVGITPISTEIPSAFSLSQNYPNPFNPVTKIRFSLSVDRNAGSVRQASLLVTLKVYDLMGREVQTLVNESLAPGTYETTFDGNKLSTGTYFYKLTAGNFTATKKLTLIK